MKKINLFLTIAIVVLVGGYTFAQSEIPDNKGKEFWLMFTENISSPTLSLFITSDVATSGTVSGPFPTISFSVTPGEITTVSVPTSAMVTSNDTPEDKGLQVEAEEEVTVYGLNQRAQTTDAFLGLPVEALGTSYITLGYGNVLNSRGALLQSTLLGITASENGTTVTITPNADAGSRSAGEPYDIVLDEGQTYQLKSSGLGNDLSGSIISADKPVAVFGGHTCVTIPNQNEACDHIVEQLPATNTWGQRFVTVPLATRLAGDIFRVIAAENNTEVVVEGTNGFERLFTLNRGEFEELDVPSEVYTEVRSTSDDKPILVAQYSKGQESDNVISDPFMLLIPSYEQFLNSYTVTTPASGFNQHYINIAVPTPQAGNVELDGTLIPASAFTAIRNSGFSGAQVEVSAGTHNLQGNGQFRFGTFMYGFGNFDSYGYPGGQGLTRVVEVADISLLPQSGTVTINEEFCLQATVTDQNGSPLPEITVDYEVVGANASSGFAVTDQAGIATLCYTPENTGEDVVTASIGNDAEQAVITVVNVTLGPSSLTLEPEEVTVVAGQEVCITGTVLDQFGDPLAGVEVFTEVNGELVGSGISDGDGEVVYCLTPDEAGVISVVCYYEGGARVEAIVTVEPDGNNPDVTVWNGTAWSDGVPDADRDAIIAGNYTSGSDLSGAVLTARSFTVNSGVRVVFSAGTSLVCEGDFINQGTLVMQSETCLITKGEVSGEVQIVRNTSFDKNTFKYSVMSTPVATASDDDLGVVYTLSEEQARYSLLDGSLEVGKGYFSAKTGTVTFTGVPNSGDITVAGLTYTEGVNEIYKGYNLMGNPYPCAISADDFLDENSNALEPFVWLWNNKLPNDERITGGDYLLYSRDLGVVSGAEGTSFDGFIGTAQGFQVQLKSAAVSPASVDFTGDMRVIGENSDDAFLRTAHQRSKLQRLKLAIRGSQGQYDETLIALSSEATPGYDHRYDIRKLKGHTPDGEQQKPGLWLSSQLAGADMITQGLPPLTQGEDHLEIPLSVESSGTRQLEITIAENRLPEGINVYLKDKFADAIHDLQDPYRYDAFADHASDRFSLVLNRGNLPVSAETLGSDGFGVYADQNELKLWFQENLQQGEVTVLDPMGRTVASFKNVETRNRSLTLPVRVTANQLYIMRVESQGSAYTQKFIKHN